MKGNLDFASPVWPRGNQISIQQRLTKSAPIMALYGQTGTSGLERYVQPNVPDPRTHWT